MMQLQALTAISPVDGRYRGQLEELAPYFSEYALIRYRVQVEVEYFIALAEQKLFTLPKAKLPALRAIYREFTVEQAQLVKDTEKVTNHDVKAVEYFLKNELKRLGLEDKLEWVHFGLTSQDVNNTATPCSGKTRSSMYISPPFPT